MRVSIIGAGLAGCEAAYQLVKRNIGVDLYEMKPLKYTDAHKSPNFAELVCSNSLRSDSLKNAVGVLKEEMRMLDSLIMRFADKNRLPAGSALAVDRDSFSKEITDFIKSHPLVRVIEEEVTSIPEGPCIIASGPLTSGALYESIKKLVSDDGLYFFDAAAPIIEKDSIDFSKAFYKSRYDKGDADYINCPMNKEEFDNFYRELICAETTKLKDFEKEIYFEGCMPFEVMAKRGEKTLLFGPMKPVGLDYNNQRFYAVVQLRRDNISDSLYNIVGFQTHLTWPEQRRIIHMIPGLENAIISRYGVMHKNSYINSPKYLKASYQLNNNNNNIFFAGQITGVEGYVESSASGLLAGINMARYINNLEPYHLDNSTMIGALAHYVSHSDPNNFQPMNINFGILKPLANVSKKDRKEAQAKACIENLRQVLCQEI